MTRRWALGNIWDQQEDNKGLGKILVVVDNTRSGNILDDRA